LLTVVGQDKVEIEESKTEISSNEGSPAPTPVKDKANLMEMKLEFLNESSETKNCVHSKIEFSIDKTTSQFEEDSL